MALAQGVRPLDPYRTLRLHPRAPRDLIVEAYWLLVARARERHDGAAHEALIDDLNESYGILMNDARREEYDREHGVSRPDGGAPAPSRRWFGFGGKRQPRAADDYYELLRLDPAADAELVELAATLLARSQVDDDADLVGRARRTLGHPQLRAQYDAMLSREREARAQSKSVVRDPSHRNREPGHEAAADSVKSAVSAGAGADPTGAATGERAAPQPAARPSGLAGPGPREASPARAVAPSEADAPHPPAAGPPASAISSVDEAAHATPAVSPSAIPPGGKEARARGHGFLGRSHGRAGDEADTRRSGQAVDARIRALRDDALTPPPPDRSDLAREAPSASVSHPGAEAVFIAGPRAGERFEINENAVLLESADDAAPSIWRHGDRFLLRQGDERIRINGEPLTLPLVVLDDGDEVELGAHRLRFRTIA